MTLVLALKWYFGNKEAIVMSSDSKVSFGPLSYEAKKIYPIFYDPETPLAIAGGAGDASLIKQAYRSSEKILIELAESRWEGRTPTFEEFEEAIEQIESYLVQRFRSLREMGLDVNFSMVLGSVDKEGKASMYLFDSRGLAEPVHDNPGFAMIGSGFFTGGNLLLKLLGYDPGRSGEMDLGMLTAFIIDSVSEIDSTVGSFLRESWLMRVEEDKVFLGELKEKAYKEYKEKVRKRKELIREFWQACDLIGEDKVEKMLKEIMRSQ